MNTTVQPLYVEPIIKKVLVKATVEHAFAVFTQSMARWWMRDHSINPSRSPIEEIVLEPRVGGRWFERGVDGSECQWGKVLVWTPPNRVVLAWQINSSWTFDPTFETEVEIAFLPKAAGYVEIILEHRNLERFGLEGNALRDSFGKGWSLQLDQYAEQFDGAKAGADFHCEFSAKTTPAAALAAIADVPAWWATHFDGSAQALNDTFTVRFGETYVDFVVSEWVAGAGVTWTVVDCFLPWLNDKTEWKGTRVQWTVSADGPSTRVEMVHVGLTPAVECYTTCEKGWRGHVLESLQSLINTGVGAPR